MGHVPHHPDRRPTKTSRSLNAGSVDFFLEFIDKTCQRFVEKYCPAAEYVYDRLHCDLSPSSDVFKPDF